MKFERNKNSKKYFLCGLILAVVLTVTVTFVGSKANYRMTASIPLTEGKVTAGSYDFNILAIYLDDVKQESNVAIPKGYIINKEQSYCCKGASCNKDNRGGSEATLETINGLHTFSGISHGEKCYLYLEKDTNIRTMANLLEDYYINKKIKVDGTFHQTILDVTKQIVYEAEDDNGKTYYFSGNPLDNWVEFGGYYWRIIRINGDGSIRMIYQGTEPNETGEETQIGKSAFNQLNTDAKYIGYWYKEGNNSQPSTVYVTLNDWFKSSNIKQGSVYFDYIDFNAGFCGDRQTSSSTTEINNENGIYYPGFVRIFPGTSTSNGYTNVSTKPSYKCANSEDLYTYSEANQGNRLLENPVGLITADEVSYAGVWNADYDKSNYLYTDASYWTMTPYYSGGSGNRAYVNVVTSLSDTKVGSFGVNKVYGIRPVINLRSDVSFIGDGTQFNPFKVVV
ncbi:MAG: hypothetical protein NC483_06595 [Ruminococcus sp.]|nr:hypothetical protein [Ruminococcus sp.]